ncbi:MAG: peptide-methionine (S)-S-oxide reductase MsrA [Acholeplasmatales bacterium]|jgi:peptide-methionine (S)-S-oxide reductase|nr:peptide-methionine (S)-S-oxide reductase MsrA [Acholeplasmatales bacterium]
MDKIIIAGGCFWGVEAYYKQLIGVISTKCVYADGNKANPTYEELKSHKVTHSEGVMIEYDVNYINLLQLLKHFLRFVDPFSLNKQGSDTGIQYRSAVYLFTENDYETTVMFLKSYFKEKYNDVKIEVKVNVNYYDAEEYHQGYLDKNKNGYCHINFDVIKDSEKKS